jgi:NAD(P)-dependent dehydrogenase (short-subunit alcohol dehydrogenase family)
MSNLGLKVLVTGASSGVGMSLSRMLRSQGYYVIATSRNAAQAEELKQQGCCDDAVLADLSDMDTVYSIAQQLKDKGVDQLAGLLHCAAISIAAPVETFKMEDARYIMDVNVFGTLALMQTSIELLRKGKGRIVLVGSVAGFSSWPMLSMYAASKHALEALADVARRELSPWGIKVSLVRPGGIKTRMLERHAAEMQQRVSVLEGIDKDNYQGLYKSYTKAMVNGMAKAATADYVAEKTLAVFLASKPKARYCVGSDSKVLHVLGWLLPDSIMDALVKKMFPV